MIQKILSYLYKESNLAIIDDKLSQFCVNLQYEGDFYDYRDYNYSIKLNNSVFELSIKRNYTKNYNVGSNKLISIKIYHNEYYIMYYYSTNLKVIHILANLLSFNLINKTNNFILYKYKANNYFYIILFIKIKYINYSIFKFIKKVQNKYKYHKYHKPFINLFNSKYNLHYYSNMFYLYI